MVLFYLPLSSQCPDPGMTDNADPQITSMTFSHACLGFPAETGTIKIEWLMNINLTPNDSDPNLLVCTAPAGTWGIAVSLPGNIGAYGGIPYDFGNISDIVNGGDFDWTWDAGSSLLTGLSNVDMTLDLLIAGADPTYQGPGGEITIPVIGLTETNCDNIFSNVNVVILPNFQGGCTQAYANDNTNDAQESSMGTEIIGVLPVEFSRFQVTKDDCESVVLEWDTEIEIGNAGFEVQRSIGNTNRFEVIGFVDGNNNSSAAITYDFEDKDVSAYGGTDIYYRLKQIDHNGSSEYSDILSTSFECSRILGIEIYPNPVINELRFELDGDRSQVRVIQIVNNLGQLVKSYEVNKLDADVLDLRDLSAGMYNVKFVGAEASSLGTKQIIKLQSE